MAEAPIVLVIEDDPLVRFSITAYLEDCGFTCLESRNGIEGLECFHRVKIDIVVTDLRMPLLDGLGVVKALHETAPCTPVILLTGLDDAEVAEVAKAAGAWACLFKPLVKMELLVTVIRVLLETAQSTREAP